MSRGIKYLLGLLSIVSVFVILYMTLEYYGRQRSIAIFVGIPLILGWMIGLMQFKNPVAVAFQYTTLVLCVIAPLVGEGLICILMAAPIVYPIVLIVAYVRSRLADRDNHRNLSSVMLILPFLYTGYFEDPHAVGKLESLNSTVIVDVAPEALWNTLEDMNWNIPDNRPVMLKLGYPVPQKIISEKSRLGNKRRIVFNNGTIVGTITKSVAGRELVLALDYEDARGEFFNRWVDLVEMRFELKPLDTQRTELTHTAVYHRKLPLGFYFRPIEKFSASILENYLLTSFAKYVERKDGFSGLSGE